MIRFYLFTTLNLELSFLILVIIACFGGDSCCKSSNQCNVDEGDCDSDSDCKVGLKCGSDNCKVKTGLDWDYADNCCFKPGLIIIL